MILLALYFFLWMGLHACPFYTLTKQKDKKPDSPKLQQEQQLYWMLSPSHFSVDGVSFP
jgi:hypothetical protein